MPDNDDEFEQITAQIAAQSNNEFAPSARSLIAYIRETYGDTKASTRMTEDGSLAFIGAGARVYVRQNRGSIILVTKLLHDSGPQSYVLSIFHVGSKDG